MDDRTAHIDTLIAKKQLLTEVFKPQWEAIIDEALKSKDTVSTRFGFATSRMERKISRDSGIEYRPLGLLNRGRGIFFKNDTDGDDLGDSEFFWVKSGDLIISGQFAWEGAVALATAEHNHCVVSHRYPVYQGAPGVETAYLLAFFRTSQGQFILDECSRGAAGRNRPLNTNILEKWKIPIPNKTTQEKIANLVKKEEITRKVIGRSVEKLKEYRATLITAAVTGKIKMASHAD